MPVYHYHAIKQLTRGEIINLDGIACMQKPVLTMDDYRTLKKLIAETDGSGIGGPYGISICSLTVLQETPNSTKQGIQP